MIATASEIQTLRNNIDNENEFIIFKYKDCFMYSNGNLSFEQALKKHLEFNKKDDQITYEKSELIKVFSYYDEASSNNLMQEFSSISDSIYGVREIIFNEHSLNEYGVLLSELSLMEIHQLEEKFDYSLFLEYQIINENKFNVEDMLVENSSQFIELITKANSLHSNN